MENFIREPEILSNNQMKILKHENKISEIKNSIDRLGII